MWVYGRMEECGRFCIDFLRCGLDFFFRLFFGRRGGGVLINFVMTDVGLNFIICCVVLSRVFFCFGVLVFIFGKWGKR